MAGYTPLIYKPTLDNFYLKAILYGDPGVGKTTLAASANDCPGMSPALLLSIESGTLALVETPNTPVSTCDVIDFNGWDGVKSLFEWLALKNHPYKTFIVDTVSELQMKGLEQIVASALKKGGKRESLDEVWQEDYGKSTSQMRRFMRAVRDLPMNVIFTCHAANGPDGKEVFPALTPKLRQSAIGYVDLVGYMYAQDTGEKDPTTQEPVMSRKLLVRPFGKYTAKDRTPGGRLGTVIDSPSMTSIMNKIRGGTPSGKKTKK